MNIALIFAGGTGTRINSKAKPKQFLELYGKAIIIHTINNFERHNSIDAIAVVCLEGWIDYLKGLLDKEGIKKVKWVVPGGPTGQQSIYKGLKTIYDNNQNTNETIVLINDGVRPLINEEIITANIECAKIYRSAITVSPVTETIVELDSDGRVENIPVRSKCMLSKAPQTFFLSDIITAHKKAIAENKFDLTNSAELMNYYNFPLYCVIDSAENIKITTPVDFYVYRAIVNAKEDLQIMGL